MNPCYSAQSKQQTWGPPWGSTPSAACRLPEAKRPGRLRCRHMTRPPVSSCWSVTEARAAREERGVRASTFAPGARYVSPPVVSRAQGCSSALGMGRQEFPGPQFTEKGRVGPGGRV